MKYCPRCQDTKKNEAFNKSEASNDGLQSYCRLCSKNNSAQQRREFKETCVDYLGGACWKCMQEFPIAVFDFHHLDASEKDLEVSGMTHMSWEDVTAELDKCALLCSNCHREVHHA